MNLLLLLVAAAMAAAAMTQVSLSDCLIQNDRRGDLCGMMANESLMMELARNCTGGDVEGIYTAMLTRCERKNLPDEDAVSSVPIDEVIKETRGQRTAGVSRRTKRHSKPSSKQGSSELAARSIPASGNTLLKEGSFIFALVGLLATTLTSFIFL